MPKNEDEYLLSLKKEDSYHFSIPFEYIKTNYGHDKYDIATTNMEVNVEWSDVELGYVISYDVPEMYLIDSTQGNGDVDDFYDNYVEGIVRNNLAALGITAEAIVV